MEIITFVIAVAGFIMSAATWFREIWLRGNHLTISVLDYSWPLNTVQFLVLIQNSSTLPASISKISAHLDGQRFDCEIEPKKIKTTSASGLITTPHFPIAVAPLSFYSAYLEFVDAPDMQLSPGKKVVFEIHTSRGMVRKSVVLGDKGHYLHSRS